MKYTVYTEAGKTVITVNAIEIADIFLVVSGRGPPTMSLQIRFLWL